MGKGSKQASKVLTPEVQRAPESGGAYSDPESEASNGMLANIGSNLQNLFSNPSAAVSSLGSPNGSQAGPTSNLDAETEAELDAVPDVVGGAAAPAALDGGAAPAAEGEASLDSSQLRELLDAIAFEESDIKDLLEECFDYLSEHFASEHWKLSARQLRILGKPTTQLLNSIWEKLKSRIPDVLAGWCETTPGATAFFLAVGMVVVPKGVKQFRISRGAAPDAAPATATTVSSVDAGAAPSAGAPRPAVHPAVIQRSNSFNGSKVLNIPVASGLIGD